MVTPEDDPTDDEAGYDEIPPQKRKQARQRDDNTCQLCGQTGRRAGGTVPLEVHHKQDDPADCDLHDLPNLITLCVHCHYWQHSRPTPELPPVKITDEAAAVLIPVDFEIIDLLYREGPLPTEAIQDGIKSEKCRLALKDCLWRIMGVDNVVDDQHQLIDQDAETGRWGLPYQIESSERQLPSTIHEVVQRTIDSLVVEAHNRGYDREVISDVIDINPRTVNRIKHRGQAYDFPLELYTGRGRPPKSGSEITGQSATEARVPETQQHLDDLTAEENSSNDESQPATTDGGNLGADPDIAELRDEQTDSEVAGGESSRTEYETIDPNQPQIDGSNREYLITASEYPDDLRPTIQRLNIAKIAKREQGQFSECPGGGN